MGHLDCKLIKPLWRTLWRFLKKLKIKLLYDSANPLLVIHPENICTPVFTAALFTSARTWKHPKSPKVKYDLKKIENTGTIYDRYWVSQLFSYKKKLSSGRMKLWSCSGTHNLNHKAFYRSCFKFFFNQYMHQYILDDHPSVYIVPKCIRQIVNNKNFCVSQEFPNRTFCPTKYNVTYVLLIFWMHLLTQSIDFRARVLKCNLKITHSVQSLSRVQLFAMLWTTAHQASLSITSSRTPPKPMSIESVMPSNDLILCRLLLFLPSIFPSIGSYFKWVSSSHQAAKILEFQLQHQSYQWTPRTDLL